MMLNKPNRIIIHHTADPSTGPQLHKINDEHKRRGFPRSAQGFSVGYHYLIEHDGRVEQCRLESEVGAHDAGENVNSIGIALAGNFSTGLPTRAQEEALVGLLDRLISKYSIPLARIEPHRYGDKTECPGTRLQDNWAALLYAQHKLSWVERALIKIYSALAKRR